MKRFRLSSEYRNAINTIKDDPVALLTQFSNLTQKHFFCSKSDDPLVVKEAETESTLKALFLGYLEELCDDEANIKKIEDHEMKNEAVVDKFLAEVEKMLGETLIKPSVADKKKTWNETETFLAVSVCDIFSSFARSPLLVKGITTSFEKLAKTLVDMNQEKNVLKEAESFYDLQRPLMKFFKHFYQWEENVKNSKAEGTTAWVLCFLTSKWENLKQKGFVSSCLSHSQECAARAKQTDVSKPEKTKINDDENKISSEINILTDTVTCVMQLFEVSELSNPKADDKIATKTVMSLREMLEFMLKVKRNTFFTLFIDVFRLFFEIKIEQHKKLFLTLFDSDMKLKELFEQALSHLIDFIDLKRVKSVRKEDLHLGLEDEKIPSDSDFAYMLPTQTVIGHLEAFLNPAEGGAPLKDIIVRVLKERSSVFVQLEKIVPEETKGTIVNFKNLAGL